MREGPVGTTKPPLTASENGGFEPTYEGLKTLAATLRKWVRKETGDPQAKFDVNEVLALDKTNDPFYFGTPKQVAQAKWFRDIWEEKGYTGGKHIRRIHYEISTESHKQYYRHDGTPYVNDEDSRKYLQEASIAARHLGYIDASDFSDMRLKAGVTPFRGVPRYEWESTEPGFERTEEPGLQWAYPAITFSGGEARYELPQYVATGYDYADDDQPYRLEAWFEKEIGTDALEPVCRRHQVHLLIGVGNISITQADLILQRSVEDGRPVRILYFADFDAAGHGMPVSVARQIEYLIHTKYRAEVQNISMHRIAVTPEQIRGDNPRGSRLPRKPVRTEYERVSDPNDRKYIRGVEEREKALARLKGAHMRVKNFEARHGAGQTELNALKEQEIAQILEEAIAPYRDPDLHGRLGEAEDEAQGLLDEDVEDRIGHYGDELDELVERQNGVVAGYRALFERLEARMNRELEPIHERVREIEEEIEEDLEDYGEDLILPERPEPEVEGDHETPLYDSDRDYLEQLNHYRRYQNRGELGLHP